MTREQVECATLYEALMISGHVVSSQQTASGFRVTVADALRRDVATGSGGTFEAALMASVVSMAA